MAEAIKLNLTVPDNQKHTDLENPLIFNKKETKDKKDHKKIIKLKTTIKRMCWDLMF